MTDYLDIPEFLKRQSATTPAAQTSRQRTRRIPYPKDGYLGKGLRAASRERLRNSRRRHAERCRER